MFKFSCRMQKISDGKKNLKKKDLILNLKKLDWILNDF